MSKKSRNKGQRGEREVAKLLGDWWGADMARTPSSGGFKTKKFRDDWNASGDIVCPDASFPFSVEVKYQNGWTLDQLLTSPECKIWDWWDQCVSECPKHKTPLLVFRKNHQPWFIMSTLEVPSDVYCLSHYDRKQRPLNIWLLSDLLATDKDSW